jgi:antitoxin (DNA-binding transcriptional repressor) of toxin-antitoxin stability system
MIAAPDFAAVMWRVRAGDEVVVEEDGGRAIAVLRAPAEKS